MKAPNIFDSIVMVMISSNVKFMKCTWHLRIANTCSAGRREDAENMLQKLSEQMLFCCPNCFSTDNCG